MLILVSKWRAGLLIAAVLRVNWPWRRLYIASVLVHIFCKWFNPFSILFVRLIVSLAKSSICTRSTLQIPNLGSAFVSWARDKVTALKVPKRIFLVCMTRLVCYLLLRLLFDVSFVATCINCSNWCFIFFCAIISSLALNVCLFDFFSLPVSAENSTRRTTLALTWGILLVGMPSPRWLKDGLGRRVISSFKLALVYHCVPFVRSLSLLSEWNLYHLVFFLRIAITQ